MCDCSRRGFIWGAAGLSAAGLLAASTSAAAQSPDKSKVYTCPPCGCPNDGKEFAEPGACSACAMPLVEKPAASPASEKAAPAAEKAAPSLGGSAEGKARTAPAERPSLK
jgi:hypothetical protein